MPGRSEIRFTGVSPVPEAVLRRLVMNVLRAEGQQATISITFVGRDRMRRLHAEFKGTSRVTDVLAFALPTPRGRVGDIYVCPWFARREARRWRLPVRQEVARLVVHGVLHVLGWDHPEDDGRMTSPMWYRQERYMARWR